MSQLNKVLVFSEDLKAFSKLCGGAKQLGDQVVAITIGPKEDVEKVSQFGVKTYWLGEKADGAMVEDYTTSIANIISTEKPNLILMKGTKRGKLVAGRLGIILHAGVITDVTNIQVESETDVSLQRLVYGGSAIRTENPVTDMSIALVGDAIFEDAENGAAGDIVTVEDIQLENELNCLEIRPKEGKQVDLSAAKCVVSIGRGLKKQEDLQMVEDLATSIGAEIACTRPIAEGENWMESGRYIGVSGAMIKPDIYIAFGISGQVQHMIGVQEAKTIVVVNKDKNAPIFKYADYGIVGDMYKAIPKLTELLKE